MTKYFNGAKVIFIKIVHQKVGASKCFKFVHDTELCLDKLNLRNHVTSRRYTANADNFSHAAAVSEKTASCNTGSLILQFSMI